MIRVSSSSLTALAGRSNRFGGSREQRTGLYHPSGIALDSHRRVYTTSQPPQLSISGAVTVYAPGADGNVAPVRVIAGDRTGLHKPSGISLGREGSLFVMNADREVVGFESRADGNVRPARRARIPLAEDPVGDIAVLRDGTLIALGSQDVTEFPAVGPPRQALQLEVANQLFHRRRRIAIGPGDEVYIGQQTSDRNAQGDTSRIGAFVGRPFGRPSVAVYPRGSRRGAPPAREIRGGLEESGPIIDLVVGRDGSLYVLSGGRTTGSGPRITVYRPHADGHVATTRALAGSNTSLAGANGLDLDRGGRIYVTTSRLDDRGAEISSVKVFAADAAGDAAPIREIRGPATRLRRAAAVAVADDGTVFVANQTTRETEYGSVRVFAAGVNGNERPFRSLTRAGSSKTSPVALALGRADTLYVVAEGFDSRLLVFVPGADRNAEPIRTLEGPATELERPTAVALDRAGRIYIADRVAASGINAYGPDLGAVRIYRAGAAGDEAAVRTINGSATRLNGPGGLAVDRSGNVHVPNYWGTGPGSVTVYGPSADGDAKPVRMIAGAATGLDEPRAVALDARDTLYVLNEGSVTVYRPGATGDVAPVRTIGPW